jgi:hypothetical protein
LTKQKGIDKIISVASKIVFKTKQYLAAGFEEKGLEKRNIFSRKFLTKTSDIDKIINVAEKKAAR